MTPPYLRAHPEGTALAVKVQPRAPRESVGAAQGTELKITVTAPPVDAAANEALVRFLAERLDCPRGTIRILRGATSRHKVLLLRGLQPGDVAARLAS